MTTINNTELDSKFSIVNGNLKLDPDMKYESCTGVGDIVALKNDTKKIGVVSFIDDEKINVDWLDTSKTEEFACDLVLLPINIGLKFIENSPILNLWEDLSNGKNDSLDLKCLYLNDLVINEVPFIKAFKNTNTLMDKKFKRKFNLYKKFGPNQIYRTNLYTIKNGKIGFDDSRFVYYLLQNHVVYYLGIDLSNEDFNVYLFNK